MSRFRWAASIWILTLCALASQALGQTVSFVDEAGAAAPSYVEGTRAFLRVEDPSANVSPAPDTVQVRLTSTRGGDEEFLILTETGAGTGVFRGAIPLAPSGSSAQPGVLETAVDFNPPFERDTIRAEYGAASATATMVGSRLQFLDPYGRPTAQVIAGGPILLRLTAPLAKTSPDSQDFAMVVLTTGNGDEETTYLNETGFGTGIFEGQIDSEVISASPENGILEIYPSVQTVTATFTDVDVPTTSQAQATSNGSHLELVDAAGRPSDFILESSRVYVEVTTRRSPYASAPGSVLVRVTADLSGDSEAFSLQETAAGSGVFRGSIAMSRGPATPSNHSLETTEAGSPDRFDTVRATQIDDGATDAVATIGSLTSFRDEYGNEVDRYAPGSIVVVRVEDHNLNNPGAFDFAQAVVRSLSTGDVENLYLPEVGGRDSGIFEGRVTATAGSASPGDGNLQVSPGEAIQAVHVDAYPNLASGALAQIDLLTVQFMDDSGQPTTELLEGAPVRVRVVSTTDNTSPSRLDTVVVQLGTRNAGDQETVQLVETGADTGVFEGSIPSHFNPGAPNDGTLEISSSGPPAFSAETVTASDGPYSAVAHTVGARVIFIDSFGRPASSFPLGEPLRVRVIDLSQDHPGQQGYTTIDLQSPGDEETVYLQETGFNNGVYEGSIQTNDRYGFQDGQLLVSAGVTVVATYQNSNGTAGIQARASITGGQVLFLDDAGQPASTYLEGTVAHVRVIDHGADLHPLQADTVTVNLTTDLSGDAESLTLTETGQQTGVFEGAIRIRHGSVIQNSGDIEPGEAFGVPYHFDTVRASYSASYNGGTATAAVGVRNARIWFIDAYGQVTDHYAQQSTVYVRLEDHRDNDPGAFDHQRVQLLSSSGDQESLDLVETGKSTGIYEGSMPLDGGVPATDARLQAAPGAMIWAQLATGPTAELAQARIDSLAITFIDDAGRATSELLEGAPVRVRVMSPADNTGPARVDTLSVQLGTQYAGDQETVQLTETGADTGVFEGLIPSHFNSGTPNDGTLDTTNSGPPEFRGETVTASDGPYSAVAHTVGARVMFIDQFGRPTSSFPLGEPVLVRVIDLSQDHPGQQGYTTIDLQSPGDDETVYLQETGFNNGVYEGSIQTGSRFGSQDGQLLVSAGVTVVATYQNSNGSAQVKAQASITGGQVLFLDDAGQPASTYLEGTTAHVRVIDHGADLHPLQADTVTVSLTTDLSADAESLTLTETGQQTGVFEGAIRIRHGSVFPHSGDIEPGEDPGPPHQFDTVRASYAASYNSGTVTAAVGVRNARIWFIDAYGQVTDHYAQQSPVYVRLEDHRDNDPGAFDHQQVQLISSSGDQEFLDLVETGKATGIYEGSMPLDAGAPATDARLQAAPGSTITAQLASGFTAEPAQARIDTLAITFIDDAGRETSELLEGAPVRVRVMSPADNTGTGRLDTLSVQLGTQYASDQEIVQLTETGADTGVFEGAIPSHFNSGNPNDGTLDTAGSGPPAFSAETVTATDGDYSVVAHTVGARVMFIDEAGRQVFSIPAGEPVRVRVIDFSQDHPGQQGYTTIDLQSFGDDEAVYLQETGINNGVYEGAIETGSTFGFQDGQLFVSAGGTVVATYQNSNSPAEIKARATVTAGQVLFIDDAGQPVGTVVEGTSAHLRVVDHQRSGSVTVQVAAGLTGDQESVTLQETSPGAGIFEGSIPLATQPATPNDGTLETGENPGPPVQFDTLTASYTDSSGASSTATATTVAPGGGNHAPVANDDTATVAQNGSVVIPVLANDGDADDDELTIGGVINGPSYGTAQVQPDQTISYTPVANFVGPDSFVYTIDDGRGGSAQATVTVTVTSNNHNPVANSDSGSTTSGGSVTIDVLANDTDPDGDPLTVTQSDGVINPDQTVTFTPRPTVIGLIPFSYAISDGKGGYASGSVLVIVNDPPVANADAATVAEDGSVSINVLANDTDSEGQTLTVTSVTQGTHGTAVINPDKTVTYAPAANYNGSDSFTYSISDGHGGTATATVTVTITAVNDVPVAVADSATVAEDGSVDIPVLANDTDADGDTLTVASVTQGSHGAVVINPDKTVKYTPAANYNGPDSFTYTVSDGNGGTAIGTVSVTITFVNHAPVAVADSATVAEDGSVDIDVLTNDTDVDGDALTVTSVTQGTHGAVSINGNGTVAYAPAANDNGSDSFTYFVSDGHGGTASGTVSVTITSVNDAPVANADAATVAEDGSVNVPVLANDTDVDGDTLTVASVTQGSHGAVVINPDKTVKYTPAANYNGPDSFTYTVSDGHGGTAAGTVSVTITSVNDAPVANADAVTVAEDGSVNVPVLANDTDVDGDTLTVASVTQGSHGAVVINPDKTVRYAPAANYNGTDSFTYTISDGNGGTATGTVAITVTSVNDGPIANADAASVAEDGTVAISVLGNDTDPEGDPLTVTSVTQGAHGAVVINPDKTVKYTPAANYNGTDSFSYTISDGNGGTASSSVTVTVTPVNDAPVAVNDSATVAAGTAVTISVLANDSDIDGPALSVTSVTQGAHGTVAINGGQTVTYTAGLYVGADSFTYIVSDGAGGSATATVTLNVTAPARVATGIQARYDFNEGSGATVHDSSGVGTPLDLTIGKPASVSWLSGGLAVNSSAQIESAARATKIINAVASSNAITMEAWIQPASLTLTGPARILLMSKNPAQRNLVFGQSGSLYETQLKTTTGAPSLQSPANSLSLSLQHVVYTRSNSGQGVYYINGVQVSSQTVSGSLSAWGSDQTLTLADGWRGDYFLLAIYGRDLTSAEVQQNYLAGSNAN